MTDSNCTDTTILASPAAQVSEEEHNPHHFSLRWSRDAQGEPLIWRGEQEDPLHTHLTLNDDALAFESAAGLTLWLDKPLVGNYRIAFTREVRLAGGAYDRLSDVNQFWAARDPQRSNLFTRRGQLNEYDNLALYYVGMGGNWNSTTRFRYYNGQGDRALLGEYTDAAHLLQPGRQYHIVIEVAQGETRFWVDNTLYFSAHLSESSQAGYFGLRTVFSHQVIRDFTLTCG